MMRRGVRAPIAMIVAAALSMASMLDVHASVMTPSSARLARENGLEAVVRRDAVSAPSVSCFALHTYPCTSTDPRVSLAAHVVTNSTASCTANIAVDWHDGSNVESLTGVTITEQPKYFAHHTFSAPRSYPITADFSTTSGNCSDANLTYPYIYLGFVDDAPTPGEVDADYSYAFSVLGRRVGGALV